MGHYDEQYEKRDRKEYEIERKAKLAKYDLMQISTDQMIEIMFKSYLDTLSNIQIIDLNNEIKHYQHPYVSI